MRNYFCWHFLIAQDELRFFRNVEHIPAKTDSFCFCKQFFQSGRHFGLSWHASVLVRIGLMMKKEEKACSGNDTS